jgi:hypothetical protein
MLTHIHLVVFSNSVSEKCFNLYHPAINMRTDAVILFPILSKAAMTFCTSYDRPHYCKLSEMLTTAVALMNKWTTAETMPYTAQLMDNRHHHKNTSKYYGTIIDCHGNGYRIILSFCDAILYTLGSSILLQYQWNKTAYHCKVIRIRFCTQAAIQWALLVYSANNLRSSNVAVYCIQLVYILKFKQFILLHLT